MTAIEIKNISKVYSISHVDRVDSSSSFRETITRFIKNPLSIKKKNQDENFYALKKVSATIEQGDVVGLIGKNGSGKSTLLKVLSKITQPSEGEVRLQGTTASLLEVGTGFHPELTGRENIYFNGSILGMSRKEIDEKFDEIVTFAEIEKFLDTPVKFYSSGMYVRLAFAVAAHLEPDILIVDEVLAVGDASFQKKSLGKMQDVTQSKRRTVIFVSHNMSSIQSICNKVIWLQDGEIKGIGPTDEMIRAYQEAGHASHVKLKDVVDRKGTGRIMFSEVEVDEGKLHENALKVKIKLEKKIPDTFEDILISVVINDGSGKPFSNMINQIVNNKIPIHKNHEEVELEIKDINLVPGVYYLNFFASSDEHNTEIFDWVQDAAVFQVPYNDYYETGRAPFARGETLYMNYSFKKK